MALIPRMTCGWLVSVEMLLKDWYWVGAMGTLVVYTAPASTRWCCFLPKSFSSDGLDENGCFLLSSLRPERFMSLFQ